LPYNRHELKAFRSVLLILIYCILHTPIMANEAYTSIIERDITFFKRAINNDSDKRLENIRKLYYRYINHNVDSALHYANLSLRISEEKNNQKYRAFSYADLSNAYAKKGDFNSAFESILKSINISVNLDSTVYAYSMFYLGMTYKELYLYDTALAHFRIAESHFKGKRNKWLATYEIERIRFREMDSDSLNIQDPVFRLYGDIPTNDEEYNRDFLYHYLALAMLMTESNMVEDATSLLDLIKKGVDQYGSNYYSGLMHYTYALAARERNDYIMAAENGEKALLFFSRQKENQWETRSLNLLSEIYRAAGDIDKAYSKLYDFNSRNRKIIDARQAATGSQYVTTFYEKEETQNRLSETEKTLRQRQQYLLTVLFLLAIFAILIVIIYRSNIEKKKALKRLDELNKEKNRFMGIVSHDLRSPLNSIMMLSDIMTGRYNELKEDESEEYAALILHSARRMEYLIHNMLDANRIETGDTNLKLRSIDLEHTVKKVYQSLKILGEEKGINTTLRIGQDLPKVVAEPNAVVSIFENLLSNAYKFSKEGSSVDIDLTSINGQVELIVKDEGPGISVADQQDLFKKYKKLSARPTSNEKSTGLGLYIVKNLVEEMKGEILVESEPGKGSTFRVVLHAA